MHFLKLLLLLMIGIASGVMIDRYRAEENISIPSPHSIVTNEKDEPERPLNAYAIPKLSSFALTNSKLAIVKTLSTESEYVSVQFSLAATKGTITGQINFPNEFLASPTINAPTIVMIRGYVPPELCTTGVGTKNAAAHFARNGFITIAPDFLSCGQSNAEPEDSWEARFIKPVHTLELIASLRENGLPTLSSSNSYPTSRIGLWAHSNGGQIALSVLQASEESFPTTLWAPVTAPFPYSILYFSDESADEGKAMRKWLSTFEDEYDVFDFSVTQHLDRLSGPIHLHHGSADDAAPKHWSDEFLLRIAEENRRREEVRKQLAEQTKDVNYSAESTEAAEIERLDSNKPLLEPIEIEYFEYPGADHNLQPGWDAAVESDTQFFKEILE